MSKRDSIAQKRRAALKAYFDARPRQLTAITKRAGVSPEAVRAFIKGDSGSLNQATYDKLAQSEGVPVAVLLGEAEDTQARIARARSMIANLAGDHKGSINQSAANISSAPSESPFSTELPPPRAVRVITRVQAGVWRESPELPGDERYDVFVPVDPAYANLQLVGAEVLGRSMDLVYPEGTVLICVNTVDLGDGWMPISGDRVVARRVNREGMYETTVKEFILDEQSRAWLVPRSSDPSLQAVPAELPLDADDEPIRIVGLVIGSYRPERRRGGW
jgi:hypothetical protein